MENCENCKAKSCKEPESVPYIVHEASMARMERQAKRLWIAVLNQQAAAIINAAFGVLAILGVVNDPTTAGGNDSARAMTYTEPSKGDRID